MVESFTYFIFATSDGLSDYVVDMVRLRRVSIVWILFRVLSKLAVSKVVVFSMASNMSTVTILI